MNCEQFIISIFVSNHENHIHKEHTNSHKIGKNRNVFVRYTKKLSPIYQIKLLFNEIDRNLNYVNDNAMNWRILQH